MKKIMKIDVPNNQFDFDEMFSDLKNDKQSKIIVAEVNDRCVAAVQFCIVNYTQNPKRADYHLNQNQITGYVGEMVLDQKILKNQKKKNSV